MEDWTGYLTAAKTTLEIFKGIRSELPKSEAADKATEQIEAAEKALRASEAELAKGLGYRLCRCTFPPQIMLWRQEERASFCPVCGDKFPPTTPEPIRIGGQSSLVRARQGR